MDISDLKRQLADRAADVAAYLLPMGKRDHEEWRAGSTFGEAGKSLGVHLSGIKAGVWSDFQAGTGGDLIDLWMIVRQRSLTEALDEVRSWLGVERPQTFRPAQKVYKRPPKPTCTAPQGRVLDYLTEDRNIPEAALTAYKIAAAGDDIVFPFLLPDGVLALAKRRKAVDGAKPIPTASDCEPVLFGWQAIPPAARSVVITEGEIDALSWFAYGHPAMSVPFGGGGGAKQQWIENEYDRLDRFERIYLALDMDGPGEEAAIVIAERLGRHRCLRITMPRKDGNLCLMDGVDRAEMDGAIAAAKGYDPEGLGRPTDYLDEVIQLFWPTPGTKVGYRTPYRSIGDDLLFRPADVTIWSGASGAGKSQVLSDCVVDWIKQGSMVCLSSLEMKPSQTLKRMAKQVVGTDRPTVEALGRAMNWLNGGLILYTLTGKAKTKALIEVFEYCRAKYGCDQFVIDSLMRLGIDGDDYNGQESAVFDVVDWTLSRNVHTHLVAHSRKSGDKSHPVPETDDIKGAMEIGANASNIVTVWRNRKMEELQAAENPKAEDLLKPTVLFNVAKQRHGDFEGRVGLWFNQETYQYRSSQDHKTFPRAYLDAVEQPRDDDMEAIG